MNEWMNESRYCCTAWLVWLMLSIYTRYIYSFYYVVQSKIWTRNLCCHTQIDRQSRAFARKHAKRKERTRRKQIVDRNVCLVCHYSFSQHFSEDLFRLCVAKVFSRVFIPPPPPPSASTTRSCLYFSLPNYTYHTSKGTGTGMGTRASTRFCRLPHSLYQCLRMHVVLILSILLMSCPMRKNLVEFCLSAAILCTHLLI